jgi:hypothetical protein
MVAKVIRDEKSPTFTLRCEKAKDAEEFDDLTLQVEYTEDSIYLSRHLEGQDRLEMIRAKVIAAVRDEPGASGNAIVKKVGGNRASILEAIRQAEIANRIYDTGSGWKVVPSGQEPPQNHHRGGVPERPDGASDSAAPDPGPLPEVSNGFRSRSSGPPESFRPAVPMQLADTGGGVGRQAGSPAGSPYGGSGGEPVDRGTTELGRWAQ